MIPPAEAPTPGSGIPTDGGKPTPSKNPTTKPQTTTSKTSTTSSNCPAQQTSQVSLKISNLWLALTDHFVPQADLSGFGQL
jgi:hypothetical protein